MTEYRLYNVCRNGSRESTREHISLEEARRHLTQLKEEIERDQKWWPKSQAAAVKTVIEAREVTEWRSVDELAEMVAEEVPKP